MATAHLIHRIPPELQGHPALIGAAITIGIYLIAHDLPVVYEGDFEITNEQRIVEDCQQRGQDRRFIARIDGAIIDQTETSGWLVVTSRLVQWRMSQWSPERDEYFGLALAKCKRIVLGEKPAVVDDPAWYTFRKETLEELESSGRLVEDFLRSQRSRIRVQRRDLAEAWRTVIESHPNSFGHLRRELKSWLGFLTNENAPSNAIAALQARKNFSAPLAFDEWQGYQTRRDVGTLTTMISRLKPRSR